LVGRDGRRVVVIVKTAQIAYKVTYESEVKVARVVIGAPWEELREKIFAKFPAANPAHLVVKYQDPVPPPQSIHTTLPPSRL
jgi:hypothetical protein